jgi:hypothetical protein
MCCPAFYEPSEEELRAWAAEGCTLAAAAPDESSDEPGRVRAVVDDPRGFWIAFTVDETVLRRVFGAAGEARSPSGDPEALRARQES